MGGPEQFLKDVIDRLQYVVDDDKQLAVEFAKAVCAREQTFSYQHTSKNPSYYPNY